MSLRVFMAEACFLYRWASTICDWASERQELKESGRKMVPDGEG
jgi:hypothetical protein